MTTPDAMPTEPATPAPHAAGLAVAAFGTLMLALAAGALWLLLCLAAPRLQAQVWPALILAAFMGPAVRRWMTPARWPAAWLAAVGMLVAAAYMRVLLTAAGLAGSFGMSFMQAVDHAGPSMLVHLAWLSVDRTAVATYAVCALLAGARAWSSRPRDAG